MNDETQSPTPETSGLPSGDAFPPADPQAQAAAAEVSLADKEAIFRDTPEGHGEPRPEIPLHAPEMGECETCAADAQPDEEVEHGEEEGHDAKTCVKCAEFRALLLEDAEQNRATTLEFIADIQKELEKGTPVAILSAVAIMRPEDDPEAPYATVICSTVGGHTQSVMRLYEEVKDMARKKMGIPSPSDMLRQFFEQIQAKAPKAPTPSTAADTPHDGHEA